MAIFSRRTIQRLIDESDSLLTDRQLKELVDDLNSGKLDKVLAAEWELVILHGLDQLGDVLYEAPHGGKTKPDVLFRQDGKDLFLADISTLSDRGKDVQNPVGPFLERFKDVMSAEGLRPNEFSLDIRGRKTGSGYQLLLPPEQDFDAEIFDLPHLKDFIHQVCNDPSSKRECRIKTQRVALDIRYSPGKQFMDTGYPSYTTNMPGSKSNLYRKLEEKATQLRNSGFGGRKGIILCDAYSSWLTTSLYPGPMRVSQQFLDCSDVVKFVIMCTVRTLQQSRLKVHLRAVGKLPPTRHNSTDEFLRQLEKALPIPHDIPANGQNHLRPSKKTREKGTRLFSSRTERSTWSILWI